MLVQEIGELGDGLTAVKLDAVDAHSEAYIPFDEDVPPSWSLLYGLIARVEHAEKKGPEIARAALLFLPFFLVDVPQFLLRIVFFPLTLGVWWLEKRWAILRGRSFYCPSCSNLMKEPLVYCPSCQRVQGQLRPKLHSLFSHVCPCGETKWSVLGQYFRRCPGPLVCRDTHTTAGCYHPLPEGVFAGRAPSQCLAILGTTVRAKHSVMAHLFHHLTNGADKKRAFRAGWDLTELELQLFEGHLYQSFQEDTRRYERPGQRYTLALTFALQAVRGRKLLVFHNIAHAWLTSKETLAKNSLNWRLINGLVLVIDYHQLGFVPNTRVTPQAELFTRLVHVVEEFCSLLPGSVLPFRVAVVMPLPEKADGAVAAMNSAGVEEEAIRTQLRTHDPALAALLTRMVKPSQLQFFSGPLPADLDLERTAWLRDVLEWLV